MQIIEKIDIGHTLVFKRHDGIVLIEGSNRIYTSQDIKDIHQAVGKINGQNKAALLIIADQYTSIDNGARQYLSTAEAGLQSLAEAYVIKSLAQRILLNFLIKVNGTPVPARFFTDQHEAENWLLAYTNQPMLSHEFIHTTTLENQK